MIPLKFIPKGAFVASVLFFSLFAAAEEDDSETPANVRVKTKRESIGARSLPRLIELTEAHQPNITKAKLAFETANLAKLDARTSFFPKLDASTSVGLSDVFAPSVGSPYFGAPYSSPYSSVFKLTLTENIYDNGQAFIKLDKQRTVYQRVKLEYEYARDLQVQAMANAYLDWSSITQMREIDENKRDLLRRQFNVLDAQYKQGLKTKRDVLRIESEVRRLEMSILARDNEVDLDFQKLSATVGISVEELGAEDIEGEEPRPYVGTDASVTEIKAPQHRRKVILDLLARELEFDVKSARRNFWPNLNATLGADYIDAMYLWPVPDNPQKAGMDFNAMLTLSFNLLDFGQLRRGIQRARVAHDAKEAVNAQELLDLGNTLRDNWNKLRQYREQVKMSRELLSLEQQSYSILEAEYRSGRASYLDLITNLNSLIDARYQYITTYFGLRKAQIDHAFHQGDLYDSIR